MLALLSRLAAEVPRPLPASDVAEWLTAHREAVETSELGAHAGGRRSDAPSPTRAAPRHAGASTAEEQARDRSDGGARAPRATGALVRAALLGGWRADRLGFAFVAGFHAALGALVPGLASNHRTALAASEEGGAHPRRIHATLVAAEGGEWLLSGEKRWSTLAPLADTLLVVARTGLDPQGRPSLRVARVARASEGVSVTTMPESPFAPEVPHGAIRFSEVRLREEDLLPGDGYLDLLKPFRTVEDLYVTAGVLGYALSLAARADAPESARADLLSTALSTATLCDADPREPIVHLMLASLLTRVSQQLAAAPGWLRVIGGVEEQRWARDAPLLQVASGAREARRLRAWASLRGR